MKRIHSTCAIAVGLLACLFNSERAEAGCACNPDVNNSGGLNVVDVAIIADCANQLGCAACINSCDVDCDGDVDFVDAGAAWCAFTASPNCCELPDGACTHNEPGFPSCVVTDQDMCIDTPGLFEGTYHGDNTICLDGEVVQIPAVSEWGLAALSLLMLTGGTLIMRSRVG